MNAGLGNRDVHFRHLSAMSQNGRVLLCPLCQHVRYNEIHVLVECVKLHETRKHIIVDDNMTVTDVLIMYKRQYNTEVSAEIARLFVGQDISLNRAQLRKRGEALEQLLEEFFILWNKKFRAH